ncbi:MAG: hypothetical protein ACRYGK_12375 [Janthinobacterium lividum]
MLRTRLTLPRGETDRDFSGVPGELLTVSLRSELLSSDEDSDGVAVGSETGKACMPVSPRKCRDGTFGPALPPSAPTGEAVVCGWYGDPGGSEANRVA